MPLGPGRRGVGVIGAPTIGDGFSAATFLVFGAAIVPLMLEVVTWASLLFVVLALTVARMLPVALALLGTKARLPTVAYVGWFGRAASHRSSSPC